MNSNFIIKNINKIALVSIICLVPSFVLSSCGLFDGSKKGSLSSNVVPNSSKDITQFTVLGVNGVMAGADIYLGLPSGTDISSLTPTITITGASVSPRSGLAQNFLNPVQYTVTATDGTQKVYTVTAAIQLGFTCPASGQKNLMVSWNSNLEKDVNMAGGGYKLQITSASTVQNYDIPYVSGALAPTTYNATVCSGIFYIQARGYSALNTGGGDWSDVKIVIVR